MNLNILVVLNCLFLVVTETSCEGKLRSKRIEQDVEEPITTKRRTKRIGRVSSNSRQKRVRTKRIGLLDKEYISEKTISDDKFRQLILKLLKRIDEKTAEQTKNGTLKTNSTTPTNSSTNIKTKTSDEIKLKRISDKQKPTVKSTTTKTDILTTAPPPLTFSTGVKIFSKESHSKKVKKHFGRSVNLKKVWSTDPSKPPEIIPKVIEHRPELSTQPIADNDINNAASSLYGFCRAQKFRQTFSAKGCENVTVETVTCGGVCQAPLHTFYDVEDVEKAFETCKYCGPLEYEEKLIFLQCYKGTEKRRRWKLAVRKMYIPKTCGCIRESCHKLNKVDSGSSSWQT